MAGVFLLLGGRFNREMPDGDFLVEHAACGRLRGWHPIRLAARAAGRDRHTSQGLNMVRTACSCFCHLGWGSGPRVSPPEGGGGSARAAGGGGVLFMGSG